MKPESTQAADPAEEAETEGARRPGRLKKWAQTRSAALLGAVIARLTKLKQRLGSDQEDEPEERHRFKAAPPPTTSAEAHPPRRRRLRKFLLILTALVLTALLGTGVAYRLFSKLLRDQTAKIESQRQDINAYQLEEQQQAARIADTLRMLDAERAARLNAEKRLADSEAKRAEAAAPKAIGSAAQPIKGETGAGSASNAVRSFQSGAFRPPAAKVTNCDLVTNDVAALKTCLEKFNEK